MISLPTLLNNSNLTEMKKNLLFLVLLSISSGLNGQLSIDSLLTVLEQDFQKNGTRKYLMEEFTIFESKDRKDRYDVFLDSNNVIQDYIDLAIVHYSFDDFNRVTLIEGYNKIGKRSYWDFAPLQKIHYTDDTSINIVNFQLSQYFGCFVKTFKGEYKITEEYYEDPKYNLQRHLFRTNDHIASFTFSVCSSGDICDKGNGVGFIYREYDTLERTVIRKEYYYDSKQERLDAKHPYYINDNVSQNYFGKPYSRSERVIKDGKIEKIFFYNRRGKLVHVEVLAENGSNGIVDGFSHAPTNSWKKRKKKLK